MTHEIENSFEQPLPSQKVYDSRAIWIGSFLGGPLTVGYLMAKNFNFFDRQSDVRRTWFWTILATIIVLGVAFIIGETMERPGYLIPFLYTAIASLLYQRYQEKDVSKYIANGGNKHSLWRAFGISLVGLGLTLSGIIFIVLLSESIANTNLSTKVYGPMEHQIDFNENNVLEEEADMFGTVFIMSNYFDDTVTKYVYLEKQGKAYLVFLPVNAGIEKDENALQPYKQLKKDLDSLMPGETVHLNLAVDNINNVVKRLE